VILLLLVAVVVIVVFLPVLVKMASLLPRPHFQRLRRATTTTTHAKQSGGARQVAAMATAAVAIAVVMAVDVVMAITAVGRRMGWLQRAEFAHCFAARWPGFVWRGRAKRRWRSGRGGSESDESSRS
jgi:hypothetical protein